MYSMAKSSNAQHAETPASWNGFIGLSMLSDTHKSHCGKGPDNSLPSYAHPMMSYSGSGK